MKKGMMDVLPREILVHILTRLPLISLLNSKLVCRAWRTLIQDPFLITKHLSHMAEAGNDPSFILESNSIPNWPVPNQHHFIDFFDHSEGKVISKKLPASSPTSPMYMIDSCNGLLCMHDTPRTVYICNPFTRLYIELPKMIRYTTLVSHLQFGFHRTTKEYKVIQIVYRRQLARVNSSATTTPTSVLSDVQILTIGSPSWRNLGTIPYGFINSKTKALVHGRLHWLSMPNKYNKAILLISFDLETEQFQEVPKPDCCCGSAKCFRELMVVRGCLSVVAYHGNDARLDIWVMKEYGAKECWVKEFNFGTNLPPTLVTQQRFGLHRRNLRPNLFGRVLCVLKSGEVLLEYRNRALIVYDPRYETFKEFKFPEMPDSFKIIIHIGSLNWLHN